jgi:2-polyprenyl-3-methyl-5-hydroxy-6-metoxy-1,4-benzoquinol methylase
MSQSARSIFDPDGSASDRYTLNRRGFGTHQAIVSLVRPRARLLDVGCADGSLGAVLRSSRDARVLGVEPDRTAAAAAASSLDDVVVGDIRDRAVHEAAAARGPYDQIILGDVLEHTHEPDLVLRGLRPLLAPGGSIILSLPNVLSLRARARLLAGVWRYEDTGIFDRTHLRFFSVASARELVTAAGLERVREFDVGPLSHRLGPIGARLTALRPGLLANQVVMEAVPRSASATD